MSFYVNGKTNINNDEIQISVPSRAEIDMTSSGSTYERHLTIFFITILEIVPLCTLAPSHFDGC